MIVTCKLCGQILQGPTVNLIAADEYQKGAKLASEYSALAYIAIDHMAAHHRDVQSEIHRSATIVAQVLCLRACSSMDGDFVTMHQRALDGVRQLLLSEIELMEEHGATLQ